MRPLNKIYIHKKFCKNALSSLLYNLFGFRFISFLIHVPYEATIHGQPLYYNAAINRFAFYTGNRYSITSSTTYLSKIVLEGGLSGFYTSKKGRDPINCSGMWLPRYTVTPL